MADTRRGLDSPTFGPDDVLAALTKSAGGGTEGRWGAVVVDVAGWEVWGCWSAGGDEGRALFEDRKARSASSTRLLSSSALSTLLTFTVVGVEATVGAVGATVDDVLLATAAGLLSGADLVAVFTFEGVEGWEDEVPLAMATADCRSLDSASSRSRCSRISLSMIDSPTAGAIFTVDAL
jgi:hypothetical protein